MKYRDFTYFLLLKNSEMFKGKRKVLDTLLITGPPATFNPLQQLLCSGPGNNVARDLTFFFRWVWEMLFRVEFPHVLYRVLQILGIRIPKNSLSFSIRMH